MSTAFIFPGQGSQYVGMGRDFFKKYGSIFEGLLDEAYEILGFDLRNICLNGPEDQLTATEVAQPAILTLSVGVYRVLVQEGIHPSSLAGHSVGQFSALVAAGVLEYSDALRIVRMRGEKMAAVKSSGSMAAIMTSKPEQLKDILKYIKKEDVDVAGYNSPNQVVISGSPEKINVIQQHLKNQIGTIVKILPVSQAFHSRIMIEMEEEFMIYVRKFIFSQAKVPVVLNCTAKETVDPYLILQDLKDQCTKSVNWHQTIERLVDMGTDHFLEVGASKVLTGLMRSYNGNWRSTSTESPMMLEKAIKVERMIKKERVISCSVEKK